jgi:hypothetical protein
MRKFKALDAPLVPKTFSKKMLATVCPELAISSFVAVEKYATLASRYKIVTITSELVALRFIILTGF